ncbi:MAG: D-2-hydroxyacid dehydrogenase [Lachnospiraceae bacterium]|nr:D-2-hydroxyacid dehydrogenase [Lachnospiraceae bacterium]
MKKLLVQYPRLEENYSRLAQLCRGRYDIVPIDRRITEEELTGLLPEAEILFGDVKPAWLADAPDLKWVQISWAGVRPYIGTDLLDKLILTNAAGAFGVTIAEHAVGMLLTLARKFRQYYANMAEGLWKDAGSEWPLEGRRALILGAGDIGKAIAKRLRGFDMETVGFGKNPRKDPAPFDRFITLDALEEELAGADAVFGALPETPETLHLLNAVRLAMMKDDAIIVNCGRGSLIDPEALVSELNKGRFFGVGLDVTEPEPLPADHPLWKFGRVLITPHVAGIGFGHLPKTTDRIWEIALDNLERYIAGESLKNVITNEKGY